MPYQLLFKAMTSIIKKGHCVLVLWDVAWKEFLYALMQDLRLMEAEIQD